MAIRKDLDDMLNSLKGGNSTSDTGKSKESAESVHPRKSIYDDMSIDDLLSALADDKNDTHTEEIAEELTEEFTAPQPVKVPEPVKIPEKVEVTESVKSPEPVKIPEPVKVPEPVKIPEPVKVPEPVKIPEPVKVPEPVKEEEPVKVPQRKHKKIVITGELPDYEAIRQRELEKDRIAREREEAKKNSGPIVIEEVFVSSVDEKAEAERKAREAAEKEKAEREAREAAEREKAEREAREAAEREKAEREAREAAEREKAERKAREAAERKEAEREARIAAEKERAEEDARAAGVKRPKFKPIDLSPQAPKKGFFAKLKDKILANDIYEDDDDFMGGMPVPPPAARKAPEPEKKDELDELIENVEKESEESAYVPMESEASEEIVEETPEEITEEITEEAEPSAEELLDAALAAIHSSETAEEAATEEEVPAEETPAEPEPEESPEEDDTGEDRVNSMIEEMREDAASTIADLEKPKEEKTEESEEAPAEDKAEEKAETEQEPKKKNVLERILDEDPDELLNESKEKPEADDTAVSADKKNFKKKLYTVLGAVFAVFAVIGVIVVAGKGISAVKRFATGEVKKDGFAEVIYPAVIMDIESFNSPSELSSEQIITASIWSIIMDEDRVSKYDVNPGTDTISIPYMDVEARAVEMFGKNHPEFEHCTVGPVDSRFFYSEGAYNVKLKPVTFTYSPDIKSVVKSGSEYTVSVDYIDELPAWMEKSVSKSVEFKLTGHDDGTYTINSMKINFVKSGNI